MMEWVDLDELLDKSIGDIRNMLAYEDSDSSFRGFLLESGWLIDTSVEDEEIEDEDWDDEEEVDDIDLPSDQEALAEQIALDIANNKYTIDSIRSFYDNRFIKRVERLVTEEVFERADYGGLFN